MSQIKNNEIIEIIHSFLRSDNCQNKKIIKNWFSIIKYKYLLFHNNKKKKYIFKFKKIINV